MSGCWWFTNTMNVLWSGHREIGQLHWYITHPSSLLDHDTCPCLLFLFSVSRALQSFQHWNTQQKPTFPIPLLLFSLRMPTLVSPYYNIIYRTCSRGGLCLYCIVFPYIILGCKGGFSLILWYIYYYFKIVFEIAVKFVFILK